MMWAVCLRQGRFEHSQSYQLASPVTVSCNKCEHWDKAFHFAWINRVRLLRPTGGKWLSPFSGKITVLVFKRDKTNPGKTWKTNRPLSPVKTGESEVSWAAGHIWRSAMWFRVSPLVFQVYQRHTWDYFVFGVRCSPRSEKQISVH